VVRTGGLFNKRTEKKINSYTETWLCKGFTAGTGHIYRKLHEQLTKDVKGVIDARCKIQQEPSACQSPVVMLWVS